MQPYQTGAWRRCRENLVQWLLLMCGAVSIVTTVGIVWSLLSEAMTFFREVHLLEFIAGTSWRPLFEPRAFGVWPLLCGTFLIAVGAGLVAMPCGLAIALHLSEFAAERTRALLKPLLEILAGIPSVVFGYFALTVVTPLLQKMLPQTQVFNAASAAIVVGIMTLPLVASLCDDALRAVPRAVRQAGYALGATPLEVSTQVVLPAALSGVLASFILAFSRAVGETMIVAMAAGATPKLTLNPLESVQTMTGYIVQVSLGDTPAGTVEYGTLFAVGLLLFGITLAMNLLSHRILRQALKVHI